MLLSGLSLRAGEIASRDLESWAKDLHRAFDEGRGAAAMARVFDADALAERIVDPLGLSAAERRSFTAGIRSSQVGKNSLGNQIGRLVERGGSYRFLRLVKRSDGERPLFRLVTDDGTSNWHELITAPTPDGGLRLVDVDVYTTGELLSVTMRHVAVMARLGAKPNLLERILGTADDTSKEALETLKTAQQAQKQGKPAEALAALDKLPPKARASKLIAFMRVSAAQGLDEAIYLRELEAYAKLFPKDPGQILMSIDAHVMRKRWAKALASVAAIEERTGADAQLEGMRANIFFEKGDLKEARRHAVRGTELEPDWSEAWFTRSGIGLMAKDWAEVASALDGLTKVGFDLEGVETAEEYAAFRESAEYRAWTAKRAAGTPAKAERN